MVISLPEGREEALNRPTKGPWTGGPSGLGVGGGVGGRGPGRRRRGVMRDTDVPGTTLY